jgi:hypothetical protein
MTMQFKPRDKILLFNSHVRLFGHGKLRSKWEGPYLVLHVTDHGAVTLQYDDGHTFKANGQRLKLFLEPNPQDFEEVDVLNFLELHDVNSVVIPRLGFPFSKIFFSKFSFQISKIRGRSELSDLHGNFGKIPEFLGTKCGCPACPWALFNSVFSCCILLVERSTFILWNSKILKKRGVLSL